MPHEVDRGVDALNEQDYIKLKEGVEVWNQWRKTHPEIQPDLSEAHLEGLDLRRANFEGTNLSKAYFGGKENPSKLIQPANLRGAFFDKHTKLEGISLGDDTVGSVLLADVDWQNVNLAMVNWKQIKMLGDEFEARQPLDEDKKVKNIDTQINEYQLASRANRQLTVALQNQGLNEQSSYFAYRSQLNQRHLLKLRIFHDLEQMPVLHLLTKKPNSLINRLKKHGITISIFIMFILLSSNYLYIKNNVSLPAIINNASHDFNFILSILSILLLSLILLLILNQNFRLLLLFIISISIISAFLYLFFIILNILIVHFVLLIDSLVIVGSIIFAASLLPELFSKTKLARELLRTMRKEGVNSKNETVNNQILNEEEELPIEMMLKTTKNKLNPIIRKIYLSIKPYIIIEINYGRYIFSMFLDLLAGYGYKPIRSVRAYLITIVVFASFYYVLSQGTHYEVSQLGAVVLSLTSFHGRGFFPGLNTSLINSIPIDHPLIVLAAIEAVIGLIIEISFIATFTQRYFGK